MTARLGRKLYFTVFNTRPTKGRCTATGVLLMRNGLEMGVGGTNVSSRGS